MRLQFVLPSKSRKDKFFETLDNLHEMCLAEDWGVTAILNEDDNTMNNQEVRGRLGAYPRLNAVYGHSTGKIDAINSSLQYLPESYDVLILIADDIRFTLKGFDSFIEEDLVNNFPDMDGCLHYPDGIMQVGDRQITMPIMTKKLVDYFGYIYHRDYISLWADTHQLAVLKILKKHKYINRQFFCHYHPVWGLTPYDDLYRHTESFYQQDSETYFKHLANNFGL